RPSRAQSKWPFGKMVLTRCLQQRELYKTPMKVAVIKYNAGNIRSVSFALERMGINFTLTESPEEIQSADKVIFPGVGEASTTMQYLRDHNLDKLIVSLRQPTLGICLGMQLMCRHSEENDTTCLGIFDENVIRFKAEHLKVPHMGWNALEKVKNWLDPSLEKSYVYFVHSYFVPLNANTASETNYGQPFSAAMRKDNFFAVQFHPEKSAESGIRVLESFLRQPA
ncbi:MAG TPA: imidazole glycerol phosphate synthase subunit HisH, partial [Cyclobacteriaceae bacterium]|nr:imidazole glycerol phosphate synthase subunit HisH [Cyclobacteriaceae bacterium]